METTITQPPVVREFILRTVADDMNNPIDRDEISDASPIGAGGLDLDSLSLIELMMRLEQRFGSEIPDGDIEPLGALSLGELVADIAQRGTRA
jgi:acyl carrier protein